MCFGSGVGDVLRLWVHGIYNRRLTQGEILWLYNKFSDFTQIIEVLHQTQKALHQTWRILHQIIKVLHQTQKSFTPSI